MMPRRTSTTSPIAIVKERFHSQFTSEQAKELYALSTERDYRCKVPGEREALESRHVAWSTKLVGELLAAYDEECSQLWQLRSEEIMSRRIKATTMFVPKVAARLVAARVKDPRVSACSDELLEWLMEDTQWDLLCGAIVQDALIIAKHNSRYAIFERGHGSEDPAQGSPVAWDKSGVVLQDHHYPMTALTLSTLDDTINFAARYLVRHKLAFRSR